MDHGALMPTKATLKSAGLDLYACEEGRILKGTRKFINTGISIILPPKTYGRIAPRSGLSAKGIDIGAGVVDEDYRGIIKVLMINNSNENFIFNYGDRICQLIIERIRYAKVYLVNTKGVLPKPDNEAYPTVDGIMNSIRGTRGFGSSGK